MVRLLQALVDMGWRWYPDCDGKLDELDTAVIERLGPNERYSTLVTLDPVGAVAQERC